MTNNTYKQTKIGEIPEDWKVAKLEELIDIKHGYAFKGEFFSDEETNDILLTPINVAIGGGFQNIKLKYYNGKVPPDYVLKPGDIFVNMTDLSKNGDTLGYSAKVPYIAGKRLLHNQRLGLLKVTSPDICKDYIYWKMRDSIYRNSVLGSATGTTVKHTSPSRIKSIVVAYPKIVEQIRIADFLTALDEKIELNNRMNKILEEMAKVLFKHWFVDFEFPKEGKPYKSNEEGMVDSELGMIPINWEIVSMYDIADYINGKAFKDNEFSNNGLPIIKIAELKNGVSSDTKLTKNIYEQKYMLQDRDILFSWSGSPDTSIDCFIWHRNDAWLNQHIFKVKPKSITFKGLIYFLLKYHMPEFISIAKNKQTTGLGHVTISDLKRTKIAIPANPDVIRKMSVIFESFYEQIFHNLTNENSLIEVRNTLLPKLMSGKIRVNN